VSDALVSKYCSGGNKVCFWGYVALVAPYGKTSTYVFDCSLSAYVNKVFAGKPDSRILLSFKSPIHLDKLEFSHQHGYLKLPEQPCSAGEIEDCFKKSFATVNQMIEEARKDVQYPPKRHPLLRLFWPGLADKSAQARARYYGLVMRENMLREIASRVGFDGTRLNAHVRTAYVLYSLDAASVDYVALLMNRVQKLPAYSHVIDKAVLLQYLGSHSRTR